LAKLIDGIIVIKCLEHPVQLKVINCFMLMYSNFLNNIFAFTMIIPKKSGFATTVLR